MKGRPLLFFDNEKIRNLLKAGPAGINQRLAIQEIDYDEG